MSPNRLLPWALLLATACGIDESERCPEGYVWHSQYQGCLGPEPAGGAAGIAGAAGDAAGAEANPGELGASCREDGDCATGPATTCLLDPTAPSDPGMCTIADCTAEDCGGTDYQCCDCTTSVALRGTWLLPVCAPSSRTRTLSGVGCSCE